MKRFVFDTADTANVTDFGNGEWSLNLNHQITCSKLVITNIIIPHTFYNVNKSNNEMKIVSITKPPLIGMVIETIKLDERYMNYNDLESHTNEIDIGGVKKIECTFNKKTFKWTFKRLLPEIDSIEFTTSYKLYGFKKGINYAFDAITNEVVSPNVADMNSIPAIYIRCNQIHSKCVYNNNRTSILHRLPVDKPFGQLITYQNTSTDMFINQENINYLQFSLTDNKGTHIDLNGADWKIEMLLLD